MSTSARSSIKVVGAGMSGLLAAYYLVQKGFSVEVYERSAEVGGKIQTPSTNFGPREMAANALLVDAEVETVAAEIGLKLVAKNASASRRYIFRAGRLRQWPIGFVASVRLIFFLLARLFKFPLIRPRALESLESWGHRTLGREATQYFLDPACLGIFAKDSKSLSATLIYNYFFGRKSRRGVRRTRGNLRGSVVPEGGMGAFPQKLKEYLLLRGVVFHFDRDFSEYVGSGQRGRVVIATDCRSAAKLLKDFKDPRALRLASVPGVSLHSVNVFFKTAPPQLKPGFGILFPRSEGVVPLGVLFNSMIFPTPLSSGATHSETWIFGDGEEIFADGEESPVSSVGRVEMEQKLLEVVRQTRASVLQDTSEALAGFVNSWPAALPQYGTDLEKVLATLPLEADGIYLMGNYLGEIGLNRFFHRARQMAEYFSTKE